MLYDGEFERAAARLRLLIADSDDEVCVLAFLRGYENIANARDTEGRTSLHIAAGYAKYQLLQILIDSGADVLAITNKGESALNIAVSSTSNIPWQRDRTVKILKEATELAELEYLVAKSRSGNLIKKRASASDATFEINLNDDGDFSRS